jgi:signal transduction histidine kinase
LDPSSLEQAFEALQSRINQLQSSLAQQQKLATLGMITSVIAHEFNNILTPMISYTRYAMSDKADAELKEKALSKALAGSERAANICKSLLGFARGDDSTSVNVRGAILETLSCLSRDLSKDGITLDMQVSEELWAAMNAGQFQQVMMNLIVNARSAMLAGRNAHGGGGIRRLTIKAAMAGRGKIVHVSVADTGPGIPAEVLPQIFEPFFSTKKGGEVQSEESAEEMPKGGTGLGLTICRELIELAGGRIQAENGANGGAVFTMELPVGVAGEKAVPSSQYPEGGGVEFPISNFQFPMTNGDAGSFDAGGGDGRGVGSEGRDRGWDSRRRG